MDDKIENIVVDLKGNDLNNKIIGKAFQVEETHIGPPKSYITEKLTTAIILQHSLIGFLEDFAPDDIPCPWDKREPDPDGFVSSFEGMTVKEVFFIDTASRAFDHMIKTLMALHNKLGLYSEVNNEKLRAGTKENLKAWMRRVLSISFVEDVKNE